MRGPWTGLLLATLLCCHACTYGAGHTVVDCCLTTSTKPIPNNVVSGYQIQTTEIGCREAAVVFTTNTKPSRKLCAPLTPSWVTKLMKRLDRKKKNSGSKQKAAPKAKKVPAAKHD
ncbi:C-C motif chemokine 19-like [Gastrophryne carolinensis]